MQAAGLLKEKSNHSDNKDGLGVKPHVPMAKPVLVACITQEDSNMATIIKEATDGMSWITTKVKLPNGKNAWGGRAGDKQKASESHRRWVKQSKVGDASGGGTLEKSPDGRYRQTGVVNIVLYVGLGLVSLGLIITFVGIGEHGFKSPELRLIGPSLIGCGFLFCLLRLFFCSAPAWCAQCRKTKPLDEKSLLSPSRETLAEDSGESQQQQQQQLPQSQSQSQLQPPELLEEEELHPAKQQIASKSTHTIHSTIPNFIDDECEDDADLGLNVEYMDDASTRHNLADSLMASRPTSSQSRLSTASKVPRLPDIHTNGRQTNELLLNPATLEASGD